MNAMVLIKEVDYIGETEVRMKYNGIQERAYNIYQKGIFKMSKESQTLLHVSECK